jgi:hypothetical protein
MVMEYVGGCQCGEVRYRAEGPRDRASVCYCRMCQKASGGPFMASDFRRSKFSGQVLRLFLPAPLLSREDSAALAERHYPIVRLTDQI